LLAAASAAGLYLAGTQVGLLLTPQNQPVSLLWPPNALLLAVLLLSPQRSWAWCALAIVPVHFGIQLLNGIPLTTSVGWYFTNVGESLLAAFCLRHFYPARELFRSLNGFALFLLVSVIGATGLTSFLDAAVVIGTGSDQTYWGLWERRFVSNALATLTLVPPIVMLGTSNLRQILSRKPSGAIEATLLGAGALFAVDRLFAMRIGTQATIPPLIYTLLPLLLWAAIRFGPTGVSLLQLVAAGAMLLAARERAPFSIYDVWSLQMLLAMLSVLSLSLAVVVREGRRLQTLHSAVLKSIQDAVAIIDVRGFVIETNDAWNGGGTRAFRSPFVVGRRHENYLENIRAGVERSRDAARLVAGLEAVLAGAQPYFEMEYASDQNVWFVVSIVPLTGARRGAVITHADITARKIADAETTHLRDELALAGRVMTMGMMSASLTHELSQPLAAVLGNAQAARRLLARETHAHPELESILADVVSASHRASSILAQLRGWFKSGKHDEQILSVNDIVIDVLTLLQGELLRRAVIVSSDLARSDPEIRGDRLQLQQVVLNLVLNACDAMKYETPSGRRAVVRTLVIDHHVQLCVSDVGAGFPPGRLESVFDPFVTTKPTGLGVGLALCRAIVHAHNGELTARNNEGPGATVCCALPCTGERSPVTSNRVGEVATTSR
jgi:signal transduction histidine kinase